ncbi:MAG: glycine cleavage system protein T [SAR202 cluster bacterium Casp-Chloro-G4]|nr:glycine cleavage system aminomethyltransferase GcvT [Chloroflexota bacterium]MDA1227544.1 glycine cleavage system aminomethyltransferase GcvT [Chloroflexota bacterium]PKB61524.1 MAG: glycine cleavage system protein T [SAR202 cluster bacterium Casp-Chloro-G4]
MDDNVHLQRTPLYDAHVKQGGRLVPFAGWEMPIQYTGILDEARAVRSSVGIFDVSHMGRLEISGSGAANLLNRVLSVNASALRLERARYNVICDESGGIIDDCIVYRRSEEMFLLVPNASNTDSVLQWLARWNEPDAGVAIVNVTSESAMIAIQGPDAVGMVDGLCDIDASAVRPFATVKASIGSSQVWLARTGYTGEDGFEIIVPADSAGELWNALASAGATPCGLGARDVLRLEAGLLLHGNEMDTGVNPYEAGLDRFVDPDRDGYVAGPVLNRLKKAGLSKRLVGFVLTGRGGIPRHGYAILGGAESIGIVTSGVHSPTLDCSIGMGYVGIQYADPGTVIQIDIRGRIVDAEVTELPFYSRRRSG